VLGQPIALARRQELAELGEVVVHGEALNAGPARDLGDGGSGGAHLFVELDGGPHYPLARLGLPGGARLEVVRPLFT
jgi:hypothetical protein